MTKIDPGLRRRCKACAAIDQTAASSPLKANIMLELDGDTFPDALSDAGFERRTRAGTVWTGDIPVANIDKLEGIVGLKRAEEARILAHELDRALPDARVTALHAEDPPRRGEGVIIGIIDHGIDYKHQSFRNGDTTRILAIWDQAGAVSERDQAPEGFNYGVEYTEDAINQSLGPQPGRVAHEDRAPFHGTAVAGIAAGNGRPSTTATGQPRFVGVAPEAELIIVANTRPRTTDPGSMGDSADSLDAVAYILKKAELFRKPVVINISEGDNIGPHDGTSLLEVGIDNLLNGGERVGCVVVKSAGNEGSTCHHAQGTVLGGEPLDLLIDVPANEQQVTVDIWYANADRLQVSIVPPGTGAETIGPFVPEVSDVRPLANGNQVFVDAQLDDPGNHDNRTFVVLESIGPASLQKGTWTLRLEGRGSWHAWIQRDSNATFRNCVSEASTVSIPGTSRSVITVASHISNNDFSLNGVGALSAFSGRGPDRKGQRRVVTLSAPGEEIQAPQQNDRFVAVKGTSMSTAMVTGAVALLLEIDPTLTANQVRETLEDSARKDADTGDAASDAWGSGKLDVAAAAQAVNARPAGGVAAA